MKILVTATNYSKYCQSGKKMLEGKNFEIIENPYGRPYTYNELKDIVNDIDGVVAGVDTWDENIFQAAVNLKVIARFGVGVDNIDLKAAEKHGIVVCNAPGINSSAVAEHTVALMLSLLRKIPDLNEKVRKGKWIRPMFHELKNQTIGFLGFGAVAKNTAVRLRNFGPKMLAYDKYPNYETAEELGVKMVSLENIFLHCDIISVHLPSTPETKHLINRETIEKMKRGVYLINTARGNIVEEKDVVKALESGKIAGFATDVFEHEPVNINGPLFQFDNYIATPHVAAETYENCETTSEVTAKEIIDVLEKRPPDNRLV